MNHIARLEKKLVALRARLAATTDPDEYGELNEQIDFIQDDIDEMESEVDPEDIYGMLGHNDTPSLNTSLNY